MSVYCLKKAPSSIISIIVYYYIQRVQLNLALRIPRIINTFKYQTLKKNNNRLVCDQKKYFLMFR